MSALAEASTVPAARPGRRWGTELALLVSLLVLSLLAVVGVTRWMDRPRDPVMPTSAAVEATWGVRFTSVNLTADGGLVDLRFVVLDSGKAAALMADREAAPRLVLHDDGEAVFLPAMTVHRRMNVGRTYVLLYRNTRGAIRGGHGITVMAGDLRIDGAVPG
jgi:hypothetical protein